MNTSSDVWLIFLGAILTFLSTGAVEWFKNRSERRGEERNFKLLAKQELLIVLSILESLKTTLELKNYYDINIRNRLASSRYTLEGYRKDAIYLSDQGLQEKFIDISSRISDYHAKIESLQNLFWAEQGKLQNNPKGKSKRPTEETVPVSLFKNVDDLNRFFNETKLQYSIEHAELKRQIEDFIKDLGK